MLDNRNMLRAICLWETFVLQCEIFSADCLKGNTFKVNSLTLVEGIAAVLTAGNNSLQTYQPKKATVTFLLILKKKKNMTNMCQLHSYCG